MKKVAVITGGSSGIGKATAELFAEGGYTVYEISRSGAGEEAVCHITGDVTDADSVKRAFETVIEKESRIDVVVCNAGMGISGPVEFARKDDIETIMGVNFLGAAYTAQAAIPHLRAGGGGHLIFLSSVAAVFAIPYQSFYSASKAAILALALALRCELKEFNIKVSAVLPGDVQTSFTDNRVKEKAGEAVYRRAKKSVESMERDERTGMQPESVAKTIYKLANQKNPLPKVTVGGKYKVFVFLSRLFTVKVQTEIVNKMY
jgi:NAD(P)-dependent dehydrogenase (short-subunit alcohol dehydrogenase family)